ncbi:MAG TPA: hypothetical protein VEP89_17540, partial [Draconibacterium sp.]|nr:hypothetical protein [Draconibacterium sp.]
TLFLGCVTKIIKKKFFKVEKSDNNHACAKLKKEDRAEAVIDDEKNREEYALNYIITTRWQTI